MTSILGQVVLWAGFLSAALASIARLEIKDDEWNTIPWIWYGISMLVGIVGIVLLRVDRAAKKTASAASATGIESVQTTLKQSAESIAHLDQKLDDMTCEEVLEYIDNECVPSLNEFADNHEVIKNGYGTKVFAAVMTEFASGERYVNRAWSAAADAYVDEVVLSVRYARDFLAAAVEDLNKAGQT